MPDHSGAREHQTDTTVGPRVHVTPNRLPSAHVDGAWWPQSRQLATELPALLKSLNERLDQVVGVGYRRDDWTDTPAQLTIDDYTVELLGFDSAEAASVILIGRDGHHLTLRVIAPETDEQDARHTLAAVPDDPDGTAAPRTALAASRPTADVAQRLTDHEGLDDAERTAQIQRWCDEAAAQFDTARIQSFVPILVEHIVYNRMFQTRPAGRSRPADYDPQPCADDGDGSALMGA
jgi:hypothetical protein